MSPPLFATPPFPVSPDGALSQFKISIPDEDIQNLKTILNILPIARPNYENSSNGRRFGTPRDWLVQAVDYWQNKYDWRKEEERLNTIPQFKFDVEDDDGEKYSVHFAALFSPNKDAIPIILPHGWPGSIIEYIPILLSQREKYASSPEKLPYHLIVPSLIGFGFSSPPPFSKNFQVADNSRIFNKLMVGLGFGERGYISQGGDIGSAISEALIAGYDTVKAVHVNLYWPRGQSNIDEVTDPQEKKSLERGQQFRAAGMAYAMLHATKPSTAGLALGSSPLAVLSWIGEKMIDWADPATTPSLDTILTNISIYWFTGTYPTSLWAYRELLSPDGNRESPVTGKPKAVSWFPNEILAAPKVEIKNDPSVTHFYEHEKGGHFAALEAPELLWADVEDFVAKAWKK